jgi:hypothetical protein
MVEFFQNWSPKELLLLAVILAGTLSLVVLILTIYWYSLRALKDATLLQRERLEAEVNLKRDLIQRGIPAEELEKAVQALQLNESPVASMARISRDSRTDEQLEGEIIRSIALLDDVTPEGIEQAVSQVRSASRERKVAALELLEELAEHPAEGDVKLAAVRSLLRPVEKQSDEPKSLELSSHVTTR